MGKNMYKIRMEFDVKSGFFFDKDYKDRMYTYLRDIFEGRYFTFSNLIPRKKKNTPLGFWAVKSAVLDFCTPHHNEISKFFVKLLNSSISFESGTLKIKKVTFIKINFDYKGYTLSPIISGLSEEKVLEYENEPEYYSFALREILLNKYRDLYGVYPHDDRFIFMFKGTPQKEIVSGLPAYAGPFEMVGSKELIKLAYCCGLGINCERGFGMISDVLYIWKRR